MTATELTCKELVELVTDYLEGALSEAEARRFEHHVAGCGGCAAYLAQVRETIRLTGTLAEHNLDPETREALLAAFRDWRGEGPSRRSTSRRSRRREARIR